MKQKSLWDKTQKLVRDYSKALGIEKPDLETLYSISILGEAYQSGYYIKINFSRFKWFFNLDENKATIILEFVTAHELAHLKLGHRGGARGVKREHKKKESQANELATKISGVKYRDYVKAYQDLASLQSQTEPEVSREMIKIMEIEES